MTLTCPCQLINSQQPTLSTYKNSTSFLKFRIPSLVTRSTKFGNFLNDISFLATKYAMLALLLSRLSSSSDTLVSISFRSTSAGILKLTVSMSVKLSYKRKNISACRFSIHNTISLSPHEQVCLSGLLFERYFSHHRAT